VHSEREERERETHKLTIESLCVCVSPEQMWVVRQCHHSINGVGVLRGDAKKVLIGL
jgi:hypothetical protein